VRERERAHGFDFFASNIKHLEKVRNISNEQQVQQQQQQQQLSRRNRTRILNRKAQKE
jgi:hypothetical protein